MNKKWKLILSVSAIVLIAAAVGGWTVLHRSTQADPASAKATVRYHCPMHPTIVSDRPGECPICHMTMVPMDEETHSSSAPSPATAKRVVYRSTMNPNEVSDKPGKDSMGMEMVAEDIAEPSAHEAGDVTGLATVRIPAQKRQLIGVKSTEAKFGPFVRKIRAVGRVVTDETRLREVHTKIAGYVETLFANATGEIVHRGQPLLSIYSPELLASQQEYVVALKARERTAGSSLPSVAGSGEEIVASARRRLNLFDMSDDQVRQLETSGLATRAVTVYSPITGTVLQRMVTQGQRVDPETALLTIADLSKVWVVAAVYEYEAPFVHVGDRAVMTLSYAPGRSFEGRVTLVYPVLDAATRTIQVRLEFPNPDLALRPDMFAEVALEADLGERLTVPDSAVMQTGTRDVVFVDKGDGVFEPREIQIGLRLPDVYEVRGGLSNGERVLTSANFYVDSESKLKAALAAMAEDPASTTAPAAGTTPAAGHRH
jgi:RND family efflux transporter MFP subunit